MQDKYYLAIAGVFSIAAIEICAISQGVNGTYLSITVGAIASIIGAVAGVTLNIKKKT